MSGYVFQIFYIFVFIICSFLAWFVVVAYQQDKAKKKALNYQIKTLPLPSLDELLAPNYKRLASLQGQLLEHLRDRQWQLPRDLSYEEAFKDLITLIEPYHKLSYVGSITTECHHYATDSILGHEAQDLIQVNLEVLGLTEKRAYQEACGRQKSVSGCQALQQLPIQISQEFYLMKEKIRKVSMKSTFLAMSPKEKTLYVVDGAVEAQESFIENEGGWVWQPVIKGITMAYYYKTKKEALDQGDELKRYWRQQLDSGFYD